MNEKIDILSRRQYINNLKVIINKLSENKRGCAFAIDGRWGCGKTFILEKLEDDLSLFQSEDTADDAYFIFHYNCWEYDYYEEPAVAIISAMIDKFNNEFEEKLKKDFEKSYEIAKNILKEIAREFVRNKIGVDLVETCEKTKRFFMKRNKDNVEFDEMFNFKKSLDFAREKIDFLARDKTVLLVVDELDRCLPTYAIKVLERLHHLFDGIDNVIVVLSVDSTQMEHSIQEIYGEKVDTKNYLKKFINFGLKLDDGILQKEINECYRYYFDQFEYNEYIFSQITQMIQLCEIRIRSLEKMIEKLYLIHQIAFREKEDARVLLFEVIWGILSCKLQEPCNMKFSQVYDMNSYFSQFTGIRTTHYLDLEDILGKRAYEFLEKSRILAEEYDRGGFSNSDLVMQGKVHLSLWYVIYKIAKEPDPFFIGDESVYQSLLDSCQDFYNMANIMEGISE